MHPSDLLICILTPSQWARQKTDKPTLSANCLLEVIADEHTGWSAANRVTSSSETRIPASLVEGAGASSQEPIPSPRVWLAVVPPFAETLWVGDSVAIWIQPIHPAALQARVSGHLVWSEFVGNWRKRAVQVWIDIKTTAIAETYDDVWVGQGIVIPLHLTFAEVDD